MPEASQEHGAVYAARAQASGGIRMRGRVGDLLTQPANVFRGPTEYTGSPAPAVAVRVLVVEDDALVRQACAEIAASLGYLVETADSVPAAKSVLGRSPIDVLLLDLKLPGIGGFSLLEEVRQTHPRIATVVMTAFATVNSAVEAMRTGAGDYISKPFTIEELSSVLERAMERRNAFDERRALRERLHTGKAAGALIGQDPAMEKVFRILSKVAYTQHPVLILGEAGTGKELVARAIHANGPNAARPFVPVDCGSLVPSLIEGELFGYAEGPIKVAVAPKTGLLAAAEGGTVFLDEIGDLPLDLQARLVRALQDKEVRPVGGGAGIPIRARVLAASNHDLAAMVESGRFRKDLFYRLNVVNLRIPPLRERRDDIPLLAAHVVERCSREQGVPYSLSDEALKLMIDYDWPGNVRELENTVERACTFSSGPIVHLADLSTQLQEHRLQTRADAGHEQFRDGSLPEGVTPIFELEKQAILRTLRQLNGDKLLAAKLLGIGKTTLYRKLKEYGLAEEFH